MEYERIAYLSVASKCLQRASRSQGTNLKWRASDTYRHFLFSTNHCLPMTENLKTIFEKCRLHRNKIFEVCQRDGPLEKLPAYVIRKMREDQLMRIRHEVVLVQLVANILSRHLKSAKEFVRPQDTRSSDLNCWQNQNFSLSISSYK